MKNLTPLLFATLVCSRAAAADESWRATPPPVPPPQPAVLPSFEKSLLPNGLQVLSVRIDDSPILSLSVVSRGGSSADPSGKAGLTSLVYGMLDEGAGDLDALAFSDRVADLGATFGAGASRDGGSVNMTGLLRNADDMLELLRLAVMKPRFAPADFARNMDERRADLARRAGSPQALAFNAIGGLIYGKDHPLAHPPEGTLDSIEGIQLEDIERQHARLLTPRGSALVVVGDIEHAGAVAWAKRAFSAWSGQTKAPVIPRVEPRPREAIVLIDKPDSAQTMIVLGRPLPPKGAPDETAIALANAVYGGSFSSRLNMNLREEKGYTYGASSQAIFRRGVGAFVAYSAVRADVTGLALLEFFNEMNAFTEEPVSVDELQRAKDGIVRGLTGQFETSSAVASAAESLFTQDLALDYFARIGPRYARAELGAVRAAREKYLQPEPIQVLLVGDAARIGPQLELAGFTEIELRKP